MSRYEYHCMPLLCFVVLKKVPVQLTTIVKHFYLESGRFTTKFSNTNILTKYFMVSPVPLEKF
jgi:hypothetical protein